MPTAIAIAVVEHEGRFLIGQRPEGVPLAGSWEFPGGKIESGETAEAAAVRECREETGLDIEPLHRYPAHIQEYDHERVELHFIACRLAGPSLKELRPPFRWIARDDLGDYEFPEGNRGLLQLLRPVKGPSHTCGRIGWREK